MPECPAGHPDHADRHPANLVTLPTGEVMCPESVYRMAAEAMANPAVHQPTTTSAHPAPSATVPMRRERKRRAGITKGELI